MRGSIISLLCISLLPSSLAGLAQAQVQPGDLLLNSFSTPNLLVHYRPDGTIVQTSGAGSGASWEGAAILPDGNWATTRRMPSGVNIFDGVTGAEIASWHTLGFVGIPGDLGVFSDGTLAVVDQGGSVWHFDAGGTLIATWSVSPNPFGILVDDQDTVWTGDWLSGLLWHTDDQGNKLGEFSTGGSVGDITMARDGTLFLTRRNLNQIAHYTQDGTFLDAFFTTGFSGTTAIAMRKDQTLWVSGEHDTELHNYDLTGKLLGSFDLGPAAHPLFLTISVLVGEDVGTNYCGPANLNSTGRSAVISAFGSTKVSANLLTLTASRLPQSVFGYFLNSDVMGFVPFPPGSQGNLCLGGGIGRHVKQVGNSGPAGELVIDIDLGNLPRPGGGHAVVTGETWNFQCWFRDDNGGPTSNSTDGIEIVFQ